MVVGADGIGSGAGIEGSDGSSPVPGSAAFVGWLVGNGATLVVEAGVGAIGGGAGSPEAVVADWPDAA